MTAHLLAPEGGKGLEGKMNRKLEEFFEFINNSPTCYHAVNLIAERLKKEGYRMLLEKESYMLEPGEKYFVIRNDSSLLAFALPHGAWKGFTLMASHSDSPCFKLKEQPEVYTDNMYVTLNVEKYGGMIHSTWLDRPLSIAGRAVVRQQGKLVSRLVNFEENTCIIPNLAIHLNREANNGMAYNPQKELQPLWTTGKEDKIITAIAKQLQMKEKDILGCDLYLYNRDRACLMGKNQDFIGAPRLDNLECAFASLEGFLSGRSEEYCNVYCVFDNEEVGSSTRQGADSDFLISNLERIVTALGRREELPAMVADSFLVSADNGHALHPNYKDKYDSRNAPCLNGGIVIKYHGNQKYTTDAYTGAVVKDICQKAGIEYQIYHNRSDIAGGSTLGNISISHCSVPTADIGLAQLAMHSAFETAGSKDLEALITFSRYFYNRQD